jgi:hypothetical protein
MHQQTAPLEKNSHGVEAEQRVVNMPAQYTSILLTLQPAALLAPQTRTILRASRCAA